MNLNTTTMVSRCRASLTYILETIIASFGRAPLDLLHCQGYVREYCLTSAKGSVVASEVDICGKSKIDGELCFSLHFLSASIEPESARQLATPAEIII